MSTLNARAGAAAVDITPSFPVFLYGYPHVRRTSTDVHDPLLATALFLDDGQQVLLLISVDVIWLSKQQINAARNHICERTGVPQDAIIISASHTHSGPVTVPIVSNANDLIVPPPDPRVLRIIKSGIVEAAVAAVANVEPAEFGLTEIVVPKLGGNRHNPAGPSLPIVTVFAFRSIGRRKLIAIDYIFNVHPTVLHEDSTLISGDFPGLARKYLQSRALDGNRNLPVLHHIGAAGNQSPRNMVRENTISEAVRLGDLLGVVIETAVDRLDFVGAWSVTRITAGVDLPLRRLPTKERAESALVQARTRLQQLRADGIDRSLIRTAECDCFGAEELVALVDAESHGCVTAAAKTCLPAEVQVFRVGSLILAAWPGEVFTEFALQIRQEFPNATIITLAGGELQGYLTTSEAVEKQWYEAGNAIFRSPDSASILVATTLALLRSLPS